MPVVLGGLIGTHADLDGIDFFHAHVMLLVEFPWIVVLFDEIFEMIDIFLGLPRAGFDIPVEPFDEIVFFAVLLLHIEYFLDFVELLLHVFHDLLFDLVQLIFLFLAAASHQTTINTLI